MTYALIGLAAFAVLACLVASLAFGRSVRGLQRQHARERELLLNQLCNLAGKPWLPAPSDTFEVLEDEPALVTSPEQYPAY